MEQFGRRRRVGGDLRGVWQEILSLHRSTMACAGLSCHCAGIYRNSHCCRHLTSLEVRSFMLKRTRKRSAQVTLVLLGAAAISACGDQSEHRDLYASKQDCVQDWGTETKCEPAPDGAASSGGRTHTGGGYFWGPRYSSNSYRSGNSGSSIGSQGPARSGSRAIGSNSVSRGGFGSSSSAHSSSGS